MRFLNLPEAGDSGSDLPQIIAILSCSFAGIAIGLSFSWTSPSIPELIADEQRNITLTEASYFTVISPATTLISGPVISVLLNAFGRKATVLFIALPQILAWIVIVPAGNVWLLYVNRVLDGISAAALYGAVPIYVCEIAQPRVRGIWGNAVSISTYFGTFLINVIGSYNNIKNTALICCCFPILHVLFFWPMPESPYYLLMKGKDESARRSLQILRWTNDVEKEFAILKQDIQRQMSEKGNFKELFTIESNRKALFICTLVRITQNLAGLPAFETYTQYIFQQVESNISEKTSSIVFTGVLFLCTVASAYVVELFGRRPTMIFSCFGSGAVLAILTAYSLIKHFTVLSTSYVNWLPLTASSMYLITFSPGLGLIPTIIAGELFPVSVKTKAVAILNLVLAAGDLIIPKLFQTLTSNFGIYVPFLLFTCSCFTSGILSYFYIIETKGKTLEEIQQALKSNKLK